MAAKKQLQNRISAYVSSSDKKRFASLARDRGVTESRLLHYWLKKLLDQQCPLQNSSTANENDTAFMHPGAEVAAFAPKKEVLAVRLHPKDIFKLKNEADERRLGLGALLTGIIRGRYQDLPYFSREETQAVIGSIHVLESAHLEIQKVRRDFLRYPERKPAKEIYEKCCTLAELIDAHAHVFRDMLIGNYKMWRQGNEDTE
jgi:hypothetical protein